MEQPKWTPGPWLVLSDHDTLDSLTIVAKRGGYIGLAGLRDDGEQRANARLIAAAPELYEVLAVLTADYASIIEITRLTRARAALAKARGETT